MLAPLEREFEGLAANALGAVAGDLHRIGLEVAARRAGREALGEEAFAVFADDDEIDGAATSAAVAFEWSVRLVEETDRADAIEEIELFAQIDLRGHLDAAGPADGRQAHGTEENGVGGAETRQRGGRERVAVAEIFGGANRMFHDLELDAAHDVFDGAENFESLGDDLGADTIAAKDGDLEMRAHGEGRKVAGRRPKGHELFHIKFEKLRRAGDGERMG